MQPDLLKQLKDVHSPAPISWWPLAPGWYIVAALVLALCVFIYWLWHKRQRLQQQKKHIKQQLQHLLQQHDLAAAMALLKQVAMTNTKKQSVTDLQGKAWLAFLQQQNRVQLAPEKVMVYANLAYQAQPKIPAEFAEFLQAWLEKNL